MHAMKKVDVYSSLNRSGNTGGKHGKRLETLAINFRAVLNGVRGQEGKRHITVVWLYSVSKIKVT